MRHSAAYERGTIDAAEQFGVRTAAHIGRMADGPAHLGASRFAKAMGEEEGGPPAQTQAPSRRLDRPTLWGNPSSPESGGISNFDTALRSSGV